MTTKNFLKSTLMLSLLISSTIAYGQQQAPQRSPEERAQRQTQWMRQNLSLTDDQNKKVYDIMLNSAKQMETARTSGDKSQMKSLKDRKDASVKGVLTGDQFQKYQQHESLMQEKMQQRRTEMQGGE